MHGDSWNLLLNLLFHSLVLYLRSMQRQLRICVIPLLLAVHDAHRLQLRTDNYLYLLQY